jgi:hypothetical protein
MRRSPKAIIVFISFFILHSSTLFAQSFKDRFFHSIGSTYLLDFTSTPLMDYSQSRDVYSKGSHIENVKYTGSATGICYSIATFFYTPRINVYEGGPEMSISVSMPISVGINLGNKINYAVSTNDSRITDSYIMSDASIKQGYFKIGFPVYVNLNKGMGSTYNSDKDKGFTFGLGLDNMIVPVISSPATGNGEIINGSEVLSTFVVMPSMNIGYRYWKGDKAKEFNVKLSYSGMDTQEYGHTSISGLGLAVCLSWHRILGY